MTLVYFLHCISYFLQGWWPNTVIDLFHISHELGAILRFYCWFVGIIFRLGHQLFIWDVLEWWQIGILQESRSPTPHCTPSPYCPTAPPPTPHTTSFPGISCLPSLSLSPPRDSKTLHIPTVKMRISSGMDGHWKRSNLWEERTDNGSCNKYSDVKKAFASIQDNSSTIRGLTKISIKSKCIRICIHLYSPAPSPWYSPDPTFSSIFILSFHPFKGTYRTDIPKWLRKWNCKLIWHRIDTKLMRSNHRLKTTLSFSCWTINWQMNKRW